MDQSGNKTKSAGELLREFADQRRAQDRAEAEARRLGQPIPPVKTQPIEEPKPVSHEPSLSLKEDGNDYLNSEQAAKLLGFSIKSFRNAVAARKIPHYRLFGQNRFKRDELLALLVRVDPK